MTKKQIDKKFDSIVAFSELERFIDQKLKNYSSGMSVRLAFSVAIHANREILLMDEVLAVGDSNFQQKCLDKFKQLKNEGKTIILVSHSQKSVEDYCDRVIMIHNGLVVKEGAPSLVFAHYNSILLSKQQLSENDNAKRKIKFKSDNRWGDFKITIESIDFDNKKKEFIAGDVITGSVLVKTRDNKLRDSLFNLNLSLGMYNMKDCLMFLDKTFLKNTINDEFRIPFKFSINNFVEGIYRFTIRIDNKDSEKNGIIHDHWDKDNQIFIRNKSSKYPGAINIGSIFGSDKKIIGLMRMRNEELILKDTLDSFSKNVDGIILFDDASTDRSVEIAREHSAVIEIIENKIWKKNRQSEETENRQMLLEYAQKYNPEWIFYSDCDERFEGDIKGFLVSKEADDVDGVRISLFDAYITKNDKVPYDGGSLYNFRKFFGIEKRDILMIWKNKPVIGFVGLDQREPIVDGRIITKFYCQHYGKSLSEEHWDQTCEYYMNNFPEPYKSKWKERKNKAIHDVSDFGTQLYPWSVVKDNALKIN
jgi:ABC-type sugar transport system ATPase subunit